MAVFYIEGFDHLNYNLLPRKDYALPNTGFMTSGYLAGQALGLTYSSFNAPIGLNKALPGVFTTVFGGFRWKPSTVFVAQLAVFGTLDIFALRVGLTKTFRIGMDSNRRVVIRNSGGTVIATGSLIFDADVWHYVEFKLVINGASGSIEVRVDGEPGVNPDIPTTTGNFGSTGVDNICYISFDSTGTTPSINHFFDDVYLLDTTASAPTNTFLGDCRVETLYPDGVGAHSDWTPNAAGANWTKVQEHTGTFPDGDTTYVSSPTPGDTDAYTMSDLSIVTGLVFAVQADLYARKDDAGLRQIAALIRDGGADYINAHTRTLSVDYMYYTDIYDRDSPSGSQWSVAIVNAIEAGQQVIT